MSSLARKKRNFIIVALIIPTVLLICFVVFPAIDLFKMSFTNWDGISASSDFICLIIISPCSTTWICGSRLGIMRCTLWSTCA